MKVNRAGATLPVQRPMLILAMVLPRWWPEMKPAWLRRGQGAGA